MNKNIVISDSKRLEKIKQEISKQGKRNLHVLSDFDRTLTRGTVNGKKVPSLISILYDTGEYLGKNYSKKAQSLEEKYYPIETNPKIPIEEKKKAMEEWWRKHCRLLIKSGLNKKYLREVIKSPKIKFRKEALKLLDFLNAHRIPLVIMSSSGLGRGIISMLLNKKGKLYTNIYIISNSFIWNKEGNAVDFETPVVHVFSKDETLLRDFPFYSEIKNRKNVLLLGDSLGDVGMVEGFDYNYLIKVGFLNEKIKENLEEYKKVYDILILRDSSMDYVNSLLKKITQTK